MRILKKALPLWCAFFVSGYSAVVIAAQCEQTHHAETVKIAHIYDGDTVKLTDGRRVRLIGINTPETAKEDKPAEAYADQATAHLKTLLKDADLSLVVGKEPKDRYKRWLAHLYADGQHVGESLLENGLAYHIAVPPNLSYLNCLKSAEQRAVEAKLGLWNQSPIRDVASLKNRESGFRILKGKVEAVKKIRSGWILEIGDELAVKFSPIVAEQLGGKVKIEAFEGKVLTIRGWIKPKSHNAPAHYQPWLMNISHSAHIQH
ncbi:thermonuclease family protein [Neptuniibacter sp. QD37_6]|uniref:thermonuclease family protein n=1 Tax=Neptuniibacter sp. QD37_6 TaxID=3398210 RepID=UPI0039F44A8F